MSFKVSVIEVYGDNKITVAEYFHIKDIWNKAVDECAKIANECEITDELCAEYGHDMEPEDIMAAEIGNRIKSRET